MMAVEERLAHVEGLVAGQSLLLGDLRTSLTNFEARVDQRFDQVETRFTIVEGRLAALDQKIDSRCDGVEQRLGARIDALDQKQTERMGALENQLHTLDATVTSTAQQIRRDMGVMFGWTMAGVIAIMATVAAAAFTR